MNGHVEVVRVLLECDPSTVSVQNNVSWPELILFWIWSDCLVCLVISFIFHIWYYHSLSRFFLITEWWPSYPLCCKKSYRGSGSCIVGVWSFHSFCKGLGKLTWVDIVLKVICLCHGSCCFVDFSYLIISLSLSFLPRIRTRTVPSTMLQGMVTWKWFVSCWSVIPPLFLSRTM